MGSRSLDSQGVAKILAKLDPASSPQLAFVRRAPTGLSGDPGTLLCLSASFNPMTAAHVGLIEKASRLLPPRETLLLLATANVDKAISGLPLETRLDLLLRYADPRPDVSIGVIAHGRFADKVDAIRAAYPDATRVVFLLGFDTLIRLFDPKYYDDPETSLARLFRWSECVVANRGPDDPGALSAFLIRPDVAPFAHRIHLVWLPGHLAAVSATDVRARLARGEPIAGLVPPEITAALETWWHGGRQT